MKKSVAIGGAEKGRTRWSINAGEIDKEIIKLSAKSNPKLLFIPTASGDSELYCKDAQDHFGKELGCRVDFLRLIAKKPSQKQIREKILNTDIIYVGGGNTLKMMKIWRKTGLDYLLKRAYQKGIVLSGVSAGAICWFEAGHSNSLSYFNPANKKYIKVRGIGLVRGIFCPHYNEKYKGGISRRGDFLKMIKKSGAHGIGVDGDCAVEFADKHFKIISNKPNANAYRVYQKSGKVYEIIINPQNHFLPIDYLYNKDEN